MKDADRFLLLLEKGAPCDPGVFLTAIPIWRVGDTFLAGSDLQRFRILEIAKADGSDLLARDFDAVWVVEPVD